MISSRYEKYKNKRKLISEQNEIANVIVRNDAKIKEYIKKINSYNANILKTENLNQDSNIQSVSIQDYTDMSGIKYLNNISKSLDSDNIQKFINDYNKFMFESTLTSTIRIERDRIELNTPDSSLPYAEAKSKLIISEDNYWQINKLIEENLQKIEEISLIHSKISNKVKDGYSKEDIKDLYDQLTQIKRELYMVDISNEIKYYDNVKYDNILENKFKEKRSISWIKVLRPSLYIVIFSSVLLIAAGIVLFLVK